MSFGKVHTRTMDVPPPAGMFLNPTREDADCGVQHQPGWWVLGGGCGGQTAGQEALLLPLMLLTVKASEQILTAAFVNGCWKLVLRHA